MYAVIDKNAVPQHDLRENAEQALLSLRQNNRDADWALVMQLVAPTPGTEPLERLYALAGLLLNASGTNPFELGIEKAELDGSTTVVSAVQIMQQARYWIDGMTDAH